MNGKEKRETEISATTVWTEERGQLSDIIGGINEELRLYKHQ